MSASAHSAGEAMTRSRPDRNTAPSKSDPRLYVSHELADVLEALASDPSTRIPPAVLMTPLASQARETDASTS